MHLPEQLEVLQQPARLRIMALLYRQTDVAAAAARVSTGLTAGNLDSHARRLEAEGLLEQRKALARSGFEARLRITEAGLQRFAEYLDWLEAFARQLRG